MTAILLKSHTKALIFEKWLDYWWNGQNKNLCTYYESNCLIFCIRRWTCDIWVLHPQVSKQNSVTWFCSSPPGNGQSNWLFTVKRRINVPFELFETFEEFWSVIFLQVWGAIIIVYEFWLKAPIFHTDTFLVGGHLIFT